MSPKVYDPLPPLPEECEGRYILDTPQLVEMLSLASAQTVYTWNKNRTGPPFYNTGKGLRFKCREVMAWFNSRKGVLDKESSRKSADELDLNETAQLIGLSRIELQEAIRKGTAPPYRVNGRSIHWIRAEVEAWMAEQS